MTPPTPFYLIVGAILGVVAITLAALRASSEYQWVEATVEFGQNAGGILFSGITIVYLISEGSTVLAERYKKERYEKGQRDMLDRMVKDKKITPEEKREYERDLEERRNK